MPFFQSDSQTNTHDLKLSEYHKIWTKFCFLDETGNLNDTKDPYFTVGIIKMSQPHYLQSKILYERQKRNFHDEMKFNMLSKHNIEFSKFCIASLLDTRSVYFYSYTISKKSSYYLSHFNGNPWQAYEEITQKLLEASLSEQEIVILIADHITTPKDVHFEVNTKKNFNSKKGRLALAGVCRFDSKSNDLLQLVDLIIGTISYEIKMSKKIVPGSKYKIELVDFLKTNLGATTFINGFRNRIFNIFVDKTDGIQT
jgi:hypothetical protein